MINFPRNTKQINPRLDYQGIFVLFFLLFSDSVFLNPYQSLLLHSVPQLVGHTGPVRDACFRYCSVQDDEVSIHIYVSCKLVFEITNLVFHL